MMKKLLAFVLVSSLLVIGISAAQNNPPPYLYYYSRMLGGIIVERADGSDSRHLGADVIPPDMTGLTGPGWSPSGRYFAASGIYYGDYNSSSGATFIIDSNGDTRVPWLQMVASGGAMDWSPGDEDLLLVGGNVAANYPAYQSFHQSFFWLIDPKSDSVLAEFGMMGYGVGDTVWAMDAESVILYMNPETYTRQYFRVTMHFDGTVLKEPITQAEFEAHYTEPDYDAVDPIPDAYGVSTSGRYEASGKYPTILRDLETETEVELPTHSQGTNCRAYTWSVDEQYIITLDGTLVAGGGCAGAVIGLTDARGELWRELGGCSWDTPPCAAWLPPPVDINSMPPGQPEPIQLDAVGFDPVEDVMYFLDTSNPATRLRCGENGARYIVDTATAVVLFELNDPQPCLYSADDYYAEEGGLPIVAAYDEVHKLVAIYPWRGPAVQVWELCDDRIGIPIKLLNTYAFDMDFSSDGEQLRARNVNAWKIYDVADILNSADNHC